MQLLWVMLAIHWEHQHQIWYGERFPFDPPGSSWHRILTLFANYVQTIQRPRHFIVSDIGSFANKPHNRSDRCGQKFHMNDANHMIRRQMHHRCQKHGAMCTWLRRIIWSARKIRRCDIRRMGVRIASLSYWNMYDASLSASVSCIFALYRLSVWPALRLQYIWQY